MILKGTDKLLIGVIYRSPSCKSGNHDKLRTFMRNAADIGTSHVLIMGDFNYGEINWANGTTPNQLTNPATAFAYYRAEQHANTLDLVITNEEGMVDNILLSAPVGKKPSFMHYL